MLLYMRNVLIAKEANYAGERAARRTRLEHARSCQRGGGEPGHRAGDGAWLQTTPAEDSQKGGRCFGYFRRGTQGNDVTISAATCLPDVERSRAGWSCGAGS